MVYIAYWHSLTWYSMENLADQSYLDNSRVRIYSSGAVEWVQGLRWVTECTMDLTYFPFDTQVSAIHYSDVIMSAMASQITRLTIVYSIVYSSANQRKHQSSASLAFVWGNSPVTGEFPAQMASNSGNISIWWRHHDLNYASWYTNDTKTFHFLMLIDHVLFSTSV